MNVGPWYGFIETFLQIGYCSLQGGRQSPRNGCGEELKAQGSLRARLRHEKGHGTQASHLTLAINAASRGAPFLHMGLRLDSEPLTDGALARAFVSMPLLPAKTIGLIHWHALKLWLQGMRRRRYERPAVAP